MKNKLIILVPVVLLVLVGLFYLQNNNLQSNNDNKTIIFNASEVLYEPDVLFNRTPYIIHGKVLKVKEKIEKLELTPQQEEEFKEKKITRIEVPFIIFEIEVKEIFKGLDNNVKKIDVVLVDDANSQDILKNNEEYILFLNENYLFKGKYTPVGYAQGVYKREGNSVAKSQFIDETIELENLRNKF